MKQIITLFKPLSIIAIAVTFWGCSAQRQPRHLAPDWVMGGFVRPAGVNPVIEPDSTTTFMNPMNGQLVHWENNDTFNPAAVVKGDSIYVLYRAEDKTGIKIGHRTSRLGLAASADGTHFNRQKTPVFYPGADSQREFEWPGGTEDPRIAESEDGTYVMFYTQWNRKVPRLGVATSKDLKNWTKYGPIFKKSNILPELVNKSHKSASIVTKLENGKQLITKVNGKYWMYWGEHGVYGATSDNLLDWEPVVDEKGQLKAFISPREGYFDSSLTECGPPAILTDKGILLLYNGKNHPEKGDKRFNKGTYSAGQVLFDSKDPGKVLARMDVPFLRPMEAFEKSGQYVDGTVFIEGLVYFKQKWFLYYGCADSKVGVAIFDPQHPAALDPIPNEK
ncbi:glycoside hydrolase family 130 protein [Sphingobacterium sp. UBA6308]|uniref:glycoside hydrolase family 130 protein n=1 Tax=Sphingobacterium sp. UBA6308 TaxID=1947508 RepID=UPI00258094C2|nr:glycoside hydrolase family 130 protein [Sphingobacterium sp. UBA6308]